MLGGLPEKFQTLQKYKGSAGDHHPSSPPSTGLELALMLPKHRVIWMKFSFLLHLEPSGWMNSAVPPHTWSKAWHRCGDEDHPTLAQDENGHLSCLPKLERLVYPMGNSVFKFGCCYKNDSLSFKRHSLHSIAEPCFQQAFSNTKTFQPKARKI